MDELYPLVVSQTQTLMTASNPAIPQAYLAILQGCVTATVAKLELEALADQHVIIANALQTGIQMLAMVLKAVVIA